MISKKRHALNPYVSAGMDYSTLKFFGHYNDPDKKINFSTSSAPYIGKINSTNGTIGAGMEWRLAREHDFIHIFAEARYAFGVSREADRYFSNTEVADATSVNLGVSFGFLR
jgi:hypothetical protein